MDRLNDGSGNKTSNNLNMTVDCMSDIYPCTSQHNTTTERYKTETSHPEPDSTEPFPDITQGYSDTTEPFPDITQRYSDITEPFPDITQRYSDSTEPFPDITQRYSDSTEPFPNITQRYPDTTEPFQDITEPFPDSTHHYPDFTQPYSERATLDRDTPWKVFLVYHVVLCGCITFCIFLGNIITLVALFKNRNLRIQRYAFIGSLCVADICVALCFIAYTVIWIVKRQDTTDGWGPEDIIIVVSIYISIFHLIVIALDRFIAIVLPLRYASLVTPRVTAVMIASSWVLPVAIFSPVYIHAMSVHVYIDGLIYVDRVHYFVLVTTCAVLSLLMCLLYGKIMMEAQKQTRKMRQRRLAFKPITHGQAEVPQHPSLYQKGTKLVLRILLTCIIMYFPYVLHAVCHLQNTTPMFYKDVLQAVGEQCMMANSAVNILIYAVTLKAFRKAHRDIFCKC